MKCNTYRVLLERTRTIKEYRIVTVGATDQDWAAKDAKGTLGEWTLDSDQVVSCDAVHITKID